MRRALHVARLIVYVVRLPAYMMPARFRYNATWSAMARSRAGVSLLFFGKRARQVLLLRVRCWFTRFFIVMKRPSYRERTCLLSRAYERFTVVKIWADQICACNNGVQGFRNGTLCGENSRGEVGNLALPTAQFVPGYYKSFGLFIVSDTTKKVRRKQHRTLELSRLC